MAKKKTTYSWIILILAAIGIVFGLINSVLKLINIKTLITPALFSNPIVNIINLVLSIIGLVILIMFFFKLNYFMKIKKKFFLFLRKITIN